MRAVTQRPSSRSREAMLRQRALGRELREDHGNAAANRRSVAKVGACAEEEALLAAGRWTPRRDVRAMEVYLGRSAVRRTQDDAIEPVHRGRSRELELALLHLLKEV